MTAELAAELERRGRFDSRRAGVPPTEDRRRTDRRSTDRSAGLDLLRAIACALVVVFHLRTVLNVEFGPLNRVIEGGDSGVYIFFALSGYLLYRPFLGRPVDLRAYGLKRAARILPGYYLALLGLTLLTRSALPLEHPLPYLAIAGSYSIPLRGFLGSAWTLSAELVFYVTLPLIARLARGRELTVLATIATMSISLALVLRASLAPGIEWLSGSYPVVVYAFVPGMVLAVVEQRGTAFRRLASGLMLPIGIGLLVLGCATSWLPVALGAAAGTPLLMGWLLQHRVPGARLLAFLGGASYAMYLWHKDLLLAFGVLGLPMALVASAASWALLERPILGWAHAVVRARATAPSHAAAAEARAA